MRASDYLIVKTILIFYKLELNMAKVLYSIHAYSIIPRNVQLIAVFLLFQMPFLGHTLFSILDKSPNFDVNIIDQTISL